MIYTIIILSIISFVLCGVSVYGYLKLSSILKKLDVYNEVLQGHNDMLTTLKNHIGETDAILQNAIDRQEETKKEVLKNMDKLVESMDTKVAASLFKWEVSANNSIKELDSRISRIDSFLYQLTGRR